MKAFQVIRRSLLFYRRTNLGVFGAAAVGTMMLAGALFVGDSVRFSLRRLVELRLGGVELAVSGANRYFRSALADEVGGELGAEGAAVLELRGLVSNEDGSRRTGRVEVLGVDEKFFRLGGGSDPFEGDYSGEGVVVNGPLAAKLNVEAGDEVVLRFSKPGLMPRDVPLTPDADLSAAFRLKVRAVASEGQFGRFSLRANQTSPRNAFVPRGWLDEKAEHKGHANMLLVGSAGGKKVSVDAANEAIGRCVQLDDLGLEVRRLPEQGKVEVISSRIFIDDVLTDAVMKAGPEATGVLTYFVNELVADENPTPYSFVTAVDPKTAGEMIPTDLRDDEIVVNQWLADDCGAAVGGKLTLKYYVTAAMRRLEERSREFTVREIVPIAGVAGDVQLTPEFPGLSDADDCRDWKPGITIDLDRIRDVDEEYWDMYRGAPKAFVTLAAGQEAWGNRFGRLTAVRYAASKISPDEVAKNILAAAKPASVGLFFGAVREQGVRAGSQGTDFGGLFLGLSMFLIVSAVILLGLVFVFGVERRSGDAGILLAVGIPHRTIRWMFLVEGLLISAGGAVAGVILALVYTRLMTSGLSSVWSGATGGSSIRFHAGIGSVASGLVAGTVISMAAIYLAVRRQLKRPARELLGGNAEGQFLAASGKKGRVVAFATAGVSFVAAGGIVAFFGKGGSEAASGAFFGAGALLLVAVLSLGCGLLSMASGAGTSVVRSMTQLALRNTTRRSGRSIAVVALLAAGCFLVISVGAFRKDAGRGALERHSGTGGFAFMAETAIPVLHDLSSKDGRSEAGLDETKLSRFSAVQMRVRDGDDASCLNLNKAQQPQLLGVDPEELYGRGAFEFVDVIKGAKKEEGWRLLDGDYGEGVVAAVGDKEMIKWILGKSVGDKIAYTDEHGNNVKLLLVGGVGNSVLQGSLVISVRQFERLFPLETGYRMLLVDAAGERTDSIETALSQGLANYGVEITSCVSRMRQLNAVQNTYLSIFQVLGGLGIVLGSVGLGLVVALNVLERRGELGMMRAIGFSREALGRMVFLEHVFLVAGGVVGGVAAAIIAIGPAIVSEGSRLPFGLLSVITACIVASALTWIHLAGRAALGGNLLDAIRNE